MRGGIIGVVNPDPASNQGNFPSTLWTQILSVDQPDSESRRAAWEGLAARYWKPVFVYIRARWSRPEEEALDLTQSFFAWMIETGFPSRADPRRGRFRYFLKTALENYLKMDARARQRLKRGGDRKVVSLDEAGGAAVVAEMSQSGAASPEEVFEGAWKRELLARGAALLKEKCRRRGKEVQFEIFRACALDESARSSHAELAARHKISAVDVNNHLMDAKRQFREILKDLLSETVSGSSELQEEFRELFGESV